LSTVGSGINPEANAETDVTNEIATQRKVVVRLQDELLDSIHDPRAATEIADALRTAIEGLRVLAEIQSGV
jgi:hypothetical protein